MYAWVTRGIPNKLLTSWACRDIWQVDKDKQGNVAQKKLFAVRYVPLTDAERQWPAK